MVVVVVVVVVVVMRLEVTTGFEVVGGLLVASVAVEMGASLVSMMLVDVSEVLRNLAVMLLILELSSSVEMSRSPPPW